MNSSKSCLELTATASETTLSIVGGLCCRSHKKPKLTNKDTIVLADFTNTTGDAVFDGAPRQGLSVELEQSPLLSLISEGAYHEFLTLWNNADFDIPILKEAKAEYAKLQ